MKNILEHFKEFSLNLFTNLLIVKYLLLPYKQLLNRGFIFQNFIINDQNEYTL